MSSFVLLKLCSSTIVFQHVSNPTSTSNVNRQCNRQLMRSARGSAIRRLGTADGPRFSWGCHVTTQAVFASLTVVRCEVVFEVVFDRRNRTDIYLTTIYETDTIYGHLYLKRTHPHNQEHPPNPTAPRFHYAKPRHSSKEKTLFHCISPILNSWRYFTPL